MRILYIEHDRLSGLAFKINLSDHDIHVTHDREMGVKLTHLCHYDFILINCQFCILELKGAHLLAEIKKSLFVTSNPMFIAIADEAAEFNPENVLKSGFQKIIRKPIVFAELRELTETKKKSY